MKGILKKKPEEIDEQQLNAEAEAIEPKDAKKHKIISTIVNVILVIAIVIAATATYTSYVSTSGNGVPTVLGLRVFSIQTDSMYPTLNPGDLIIDKAVKDSSQLQVGDIITYWTVINGERVLNTHRISQIYDGGGTEMEAVDFIVAKKVLRKFESLSLGFMKDELTKCSNYLDRLFGKNKMVVCKDYIEQLKKNN